MGIKRKRDESEPISGGHNSGAAQGDIRRNENAIPSRRGVDARPDPSTSRGVQQRARKSAETRHAGSTKGRNAEADVIAATNEYLERRESRNLKTFKIALDLENDTDAGKTAPAAYASVDAPGDDIETPRDVERGGRSTNYDVNWTEDGRYPRVSQYEETEPERIAPADSKRSRCIIAMAVIAIIALIAVAVVLISGGGSGDDASTDSSTAFDETGGGAVADDTRAPTRSPTSSSTSTTSDPTQSPITSPSLATQSPSYAPSEAAAVTANQTVVPTKAPVVESTATPSKAPAASTPSPVASPIVPMPTKAPVATESPTAAPTKAPTTTAPSLCPAGETGYKATDNCRSFVYCQNGSVVGSATQCGDGLLFDESLSICNWPNAVDCSVSNPTLMPTAPSIGDGSTMPTVAPFTSAPSVSSVTEAPSYAPSNKPTMAPVDAPASPTAAPTKAPVTKSPTASPSKAPVVSTPQPVVSPTLTPTKAPVTQSPTAAPTKAPVTASPTAVPTKSPVTSAPIPSPTLAPVVPTNVPSSALSAAPSSYQTVVPTIAATSADPTGSPVAAANTFFCGSVTYTENFNVLVQFEGCALRCPGGSSGECPDGYSCFISDGCFQQVGLLP